ncbi:MAG: hypothetical protein ACRDGH_13060 [Candidatus Limnocylindria bacterium]
MDWTGRFLVAGALLAFAALSCSTGDPDPEPADQGRIQRTIADVDSTLNQAREHIRTIDTLGASQE